MADVKITALTAIGANPVNPATFPMPMVDLLDPSQAASGSTRKVTVNQILGAGGTATLASATITGAATVGTTLGVTGASTLASATLSGNLTVQTTNLVVTSTGVGMGTATPSASYFLDLTTANDARARLFVADTAFLGSGNLANGFVIRTLSSSTDGIKFTNYAQSTEFMRINSTGNVVLQGGTAAANGVGLTFPATQVASSDANCLDDYVESTFSPTIVGSTTAGTATYSTQIGRATKVGRLVTFSLRVAYTVGLGTGNLRVGGLPFTAGVGSNFSIYAENIALTAGYYPVAAISAGNTYIGIDQLPTGGGAAAGVPYDVAGDIQISGSYIV